MDHKIIVREKKETDNDQIENILNKNFGKLDIKGLYIYIAKNCLLEVCLLSLVIMKIQTL